VQPSSIVNHDPHEYLYSFRSDDFIPPGSRYHGNGATLACGRYDHANNNSRACCYRLAEVSPPMRTPYSIEETQC